MLLNRVDSSVHAVSAVQGDASALDDRHGYRRRVGSCQDLQGLVLFHGISCNNRDLIRRSRRSEPWRAWNNSQARGFRWVSVAHIHTL